MTNGDMADMQRDQANAEEGARLHDELSMAYTADRWKLLASLTREFTILNRDHNPIILKEIAQALVGVGLELRGIRRALERDTDDY
jgi:hypothetical protein